MKPVEPAEPVEPAASTASTATATATTTVRSVTPTQPPGRKLSLDDGNRPGRVRTASGRILTVSGDAGLVVIAYEQHGCIDVRQLSALGFTERQVRTLIQRSRLIRLHRGVYAVGHLADIPFGAETAALLAVGPGAALSHQTALRIYQLLPAAKGAPVDLLVRERNSHAKRDGVTIHRTVWLPKNHVRIVNRLPMTTPERALLDAARTLARRQLERALAEALSLRLTSHTKIRDLLHNSGGHPGRGRLGRLLGGHASPTVTESEAEEQFLTMLRRAGLPAPRTQVEMLGYRLDFYWPQAQFAVEVDGFQWHATRSRFEQDRRKDRVLAAHGIAVCRVTTPEIRDEPLQLVAHVAGQIAVRASRVAENG